jgi:hypothetical protein
VWQEGNESQADAAPTRRNVVRVEVACGEVGDAIQLGQPEII